MKKRQGFTLIELLIVIVIIAILAGIIYVAVDPATRFKQARNAERWSSVNSILNAYLKYAVDNDGDDPANPNLVGSTKYMIGSGSDYADCGTTAVTNLSNLVSKYIAEIPVDPKVSGASQTKTYYYILKDTNGRITVGACAAELGVDIKVTR
ncbi:MAG: prepilin-type N-terminal cleavage/methylation domain-containing protein [Patescibacteria group bacterium]|jgi:type IV pilus assembly protein PilA